MDACPGLDLPPSVAAESEAVADLQGQAAAGGATYLRRLRARHVAVFAFTMTCSGPFGVEDCVKTAGVSWTVVGLFAAGTLYVLPQIFMTTELAMITPLSNGGCISWVSRAFGRDTSKFAALNMLMYQLVDLASYAALCIGYAASVGYQSPREFAQWSPFLVLAAGLAVNLLNLEVACELYTWLLCLVLLPTIIGILYSVPHLGTAWGLISGQTEFPEWGQVNLFVSTLFWLNTGWDSMGNLASQVESPKAMVGGLTSAAVAVPLLYSVCVVAAAGAGPGDWEEGYLAVAFGYFFPLLRPWICMSAGISNILLYTSELTTVAHLVQSMGDPDDELNLLPAWFGARRNGGAPVNALVAISLAEGCLVLLSFDYLVQLSTLLHVIAFWMALASYVRLKLQRSDMEGLWEVPWGTFGAYLVVLLQAPILCFLLVSAWLEPSVVAGAIGANAVVALALLVQWCRLR